MDPGQLSVEGGWQITSAHFEALGGLAKALNDHADQVLANSCPTPARIWPGESFGN